MVVKSLKQVVRSLGRRPGFSLVAVGTLAVGIGASTAIFSVVEGVLLSALPYPESDRLVQIFHSAPGLNYPRFGVSPGTFFQYRDDNPFLESATLFNNRQVTLTGDADPERVTGAAVSYSFVDTFQVAPARGRFFSAEEDLPEAEAVVVISDQLWKRRFGAAPDIIGRTLRINETPTEIIGVMPADFDFPSPNVELWLPTGIDPERAEPGSFGVQAIGRLRAGATPEDAQRHIRSQIDRFPETFEGNTLLLAFIEQGRLTADVVSLKEATVGNMERSLWVLLATVGFVLLIACGNVANLFLVRAEGQQGEMAVRSALGAGRFRIAGYYLLEAGVLAVVGGGLGIALALVAVPAIVSAAPSSIPRLHEVGVNPQVLLFSIAMMLLSVLIVPAAALFRYSAPKPAETLNEAGFRSSGGRTQWFRNALVVAQTALALILLVGSGLMIESFRRLREVDPGFDAGGVLTFRLSLPPNRYQSPGDSATFHQRLLDRLATLPGVQAVGAASNLPLVTNASGTAHDIEEFPVDDGGLPPMLWYKYATPGYFEAMGIAMKSGRGFERLDHEQPRPAAVISEAARDRFWPGQDVLGKRLRKSSTATADNGGWYEVVGVVNSVRDQGLTEDPVDIVYYPMVSISENGAWNTRGMSYALRSAGDPASLTGAVRREVWALDPNLPLAAIQTMEEVERAATASSAFTMLVLGVAAVVALLLGAIGLYGIISYGVSQRRRELGIRIALGARTAQVLSLVVRQGVLMAAAGLGVGLLGAFALSRLMGSMLFETSSTDPVVFTLMPLALLVVALVACYLPARRAARIDPSLSLRI